ncbi:MAG: hypothetical protein AB1673_01955 [Actinomycetota bacterium]
MRDLGGTLLATASYDPATGELTSVAYGNGTTLAELGRNRAGAATTLAWAFAGGATASDEVWRSRTGRVADQRVDGTDAHPGTGGFGSLGSANFGYDGAGRLVVAKVAGHDLSYEFSATAACGPAQAAGLNTNRTRAVDNGGATDYCYGTDDHLLSSSPATVALAYDSRGNVVGLDGQELVFDGANRHVATRHKGK